MSVRKEEDGANVSHGAATADKSADVIKNNLVCQIQTSGGCL